MALFNNTLKWKLTLATKLTVLRIFLVPLIIFSLVFHNWVVAFFLIMIAGLTDLFDGMLARIRNETTLLGACLDPIADKFFILSCYITFALGNSPSFFIIPRWFVIFVCIKELLLILGASYLYFNNNLFSIKPTILGKLAMDIQTIFIIWNFISYFLNLQNLYIFNFFIFTITILILLSFFQYVKIGFKYLFICLIFFNLGLNAEESEFLLPKQNLVKINKDGFNDDLKNDVFELYDNILILDISLNEASLNFRKFSQKSLKKLLKKDIDEKKLIILKNELAKLKIELQKNIQALKEKLKILEKINI